MKPKETDEICDKCKDRLGKYVCLGCECALCSGCSHLLRIQMFTMEFENPDEKKRTPQSFTPQSLAYSSFFAGEKKENKTVIGTVDWAICADCKKGLNKKNAIEEVQTSPEMKAFVDKIRKVTLASTILNGLEDSEVDKEVTVGSGIPKNLFSNTASTNRKTFLGRLMGRRQP